MDKKIEDMIGQYVFAWNQQSPENYRNEFAKIWAEGAVYVDPYGEYHGLEQLTDFAVRSLSIVPQRFFSIHEPVVSHHHFAKYAWKVQFSEGVNVGYDFIEFDENYRITKLVSFFALPSDYPLEQLG